jgi:hypothetical protein
MLALLTVTDDVTAASRSRRVSKRPITRPKFDPNADRVPLFQGIEQGTFDVKIIARDEKGGNVLIENKSKKPLTVKLPDAFVGVQVLKQFGMGAGGMGGGMGGMGGGGMGGMGGGGMGGGGQAMGGGMGGGGMGGGGMGGMGGGGMGGGGMGGGGGGFFSIPPEKVVKVPYKSVCLEHGKKEPSPRMVYRMVPVEKYTKDPVLQELVRMVGTGRINQQVAQAAAWHLSSKMSWGQLASKTIRRIGLRSVPYFHPAALRGAQMMVAQAGARARERAKHAPATESAGETPRATRVRR